MSVNARQMALVRVAIALGALLLSTPAVHADTWLLGNWDTYTQSPWTVANNVWRQNAAPQQTDVKSINQWTAYTNQNQSVNQVYSYPNTHIVLPKTLHFYDLTEADAWFSESVAVPSSSSTYDWIFDCWTQPDSNMTLGRDEIILYQQYTVNPIWGNMVAQNVTINGVLYSYVGQAPSGYDNHNIIILVPAQQSSSQYVNLLPILRWCNGQHLLSNSILYNISFGVEVWDTYGGATFNMDWYTATVKDNYGDNWHI